MNFDVTVKDIRKILVVKEFVDVFPEVLPGLSPDRELEFGIELMPGVKPISRTPYRMAPFELDELRSNWRS